MSVAAAFAVLAGLIAVSLALLLGYAARLRARSWLVRSVHRLGGLGAGSVEPARAESAGI